MKILPLSAALVLSLGLSQASLAQGRGHDKDHGPGKPEKAEHDKDRGPGKADKHDGPGKGDDRRAERDGGDRGNGKGHKDKDDRGSPPGPVIVQQAPPRIDRGEWRDRPRDRRDEPSRVVVVNPQTPERVVVLVPYRDREWIRGCPPGLAKKNNGCLPPGQAKKLERARYDWLWSRPADTYVQRYDDGYVYRYDRQGGLLGYLPALGGALALGNPWPNQYRYDPVPSYQSRYYGLNDSYDYRYADGAIYGVQPKTSAIQQVVALLTGQSAQVGQRMPSGYDIYNVPYAYRDQYIDGPDRAYRYNDGSLYQLDPKTQVIQAIIQLLT